MANSDDINIQIRAIVTGLADVRNLVAEIQKLPNAGASTPGLSNELKSVKAELQSTVAQVQNFSAVTRTALASSVQSASQFPTAIRATRVEVDNTQQSFTQTARTVSSLGRAIESAFRGNGLFALRSLAMASSQAFRPGGPLAYAKSIEKVSETAGVATTAEGALSAATQKYEAQLIAAGVSTERASVEAAKLAAADAEVAVAQEEVAVTGAEANAGFQLTGGVVALAAVAIGALVYGLFKLLGGQKEIIVVTKEQIELTQRRIDIARQELDVAQRTNAATDTERTHRQALIEIRKQELAQNLNRQKEQESAITSSLVLAIKEQQEAEGKLFIAQRLGNGNLSDYNKAASDAQEKTRKVTESVDFYTQATGKSREEVIKHALTLAQLTDRLGVTRHAYEDLVHELEYFIDTEGKIIPATDAATLALRQQIGALADVTTEAERASSALDNLGRARSTRIKGAIDAIVARARGNIQEAKDEARLLLKTDPNFAADVKEQIGDEKAQDAAEIAAGLRKAPKEKKTKTPRASQLPELLEQLAAVRDEINLAIQGGDRKAQSTVAENAFNLLKDNLSREKKALDEQLQDRLISIKEYYDTAGLKQQEEIQAEITNEQRKQTEISSESLDAQARLADQLKRKQEQIQKSKAPQAEKDTQKEIAAGEAEVKRLALVQAANDKIAQSTERVAVLERDKATSTAETARNTQLALEALRQQTEAIQVQILEFQGRSADAAAIKIREQFKNALKEAVANPGADEQHLLDVQLKPLFAQIDELGGVSSTTFNELFKGVGGNVDNVSEKVKAILHLIDNLIRQAQVAEQTATFNTINTARQNDIALAQAKTPQNLLGEYKLRQQIIQINKQYIAQLEDMVKGEEKRIQLALEKHQDVTQDDINHVRQLRIELENVKREQQGFNQELKNTAINSLDTGLQTLFHDIVTGTKSASDAFKAFAVSVLDALEQVIIKMITVKILSFALGAIFGGSSGASTSGIGSGLSAGIGHASGGLIRGRGTGTSDSIRANLSDGEFVVNAAATARNLALLHSINESINPARNYNAGGFVEPLGSSASQVSGQRPIVNNFNVKDAQSFRVSQRAIFRDLRRTLTSE